jgi:hypothetical protein
MTGVRFGPVQVTHAAFHDTFSAAFRELVNERLAA